MIFTSQAFLGGLKYTFVEDHTLAYLNIYFRNTVLYVSR
jgi:hypothetical protein